MTANDITLSREDSAMKRLSAGLLLALLLLSGCGRSVPTQTEYAPPEENRLVIYTSHKQEVYRPILREFEERTGIWVEVVSGGTNELLDRIEKERSDPKADVMFGGGVETLEAHEDSFSPYRCADASSVSPLYRQEADLWTPFSALPLVLIYNTKLVDPEWLRSWADLTRPEFSGRVAFADPAVSGSSYTALVTWIYARGEDALEDLAAALDYRQLSSSGEVLSAVADGSCLVGITLEETALQRIAAGADLAVVYPRDGTSCVPDGTALIAGAPHRENAEKFLDFTLSREVQQLLGSRFYRRSVRSDVAAANSLPAMETLNLVDYDPRWAAEHRETILRQWDEALED